MRALSLLLAAVLFSANARAESLLEQAARIDPTLRFPGGASLTIAPLLQARWTGAETGGDDRRTVTGFSVPRARLVTTTKFFEGFQVRLRIGSGKSGSVTMQQAYADIQSGKFQVLVGQLPLVINGAEEPAAQGLSPADFSFYSNTFGGGDTQGIRAAYRGPVRFIATIGNGARSGFSELLSPLVADVSTTGRFELPLGAQTVSEYLSMASFRKHQPVTARLGLTGHFQTRRPSNANPANDIEVISADAGVRGDGFSLMGSTAYLRLAQAGLPVLKSAGFWLFGSLFPARKVELFAQFDAIYPLGERAEFPPGFASGQPGTTLFRTLTCGSNFYLIPDAQKLKIQMDLQTMFDGQATSIVPANTSLGVLSATGLQISARVQLLVAL
ncbi:MAG TPA: hypothetical protein VGC79_06900 [Polyangiaceae bacterium]